MYKKVLSVIFFTLVLQEGFAQMIPVQTTIRTPYGNVPHTQYVHSPHYYYGNGRISLKYPFTVVMNDDSTFTAKTRIDHADKTHTITVKDENKRKQKIFPSDTKEIFRMGLDGRKIYGIPADSCWLFLCEPGSINSYSFIAEPGMSYVIAIQEGDDGPIVPLTKANLLPMVGNDQKLQKLIDKGRFVKAVELFNRKADKF